MINRKDTESILQSIMKYINDIETIINDNKVTVDSYKNNILYRHSLHMCLFQIGEISNLIPNKYKECHSDIPWAQMKGLRNVEAHDYDNLDLNSIWATLEQDIPDLKIKIKKLL